MSQFLLVIKSLLFHRRVNLAIALGVAAATAVLTGALIVGDSMRGSLRDLTLDRLGRIDSIVMSEGFFREDLANEIRETAAFASGFSSSTPIIFFPNATTSYKKGNQSRTLGQVNMLGVRQEFWSFGDEQRDLNTKLSNDEIIINSVVAEDLNLTQSDIGQARLTVGVPKRTLLPSDSSLGEKSDLTERIVDLKLAGIIPAKSLGRFGMHPTQVPPRNIYLSIETVQEALNEDILKFKQSRKQANMILLSGKDTKHVASVDQTRELARQLQPNLTDIGLRLKHAKLDFNGATVLNYFSLSSERLVLPTGTVKWVRELFPDSSEVLTYLANQIKAKDSAESGIPFSMISGIDVTKVPLESIDGTVIDSLKENEIVLNQWAADDLKLEIGDSVEVFWFEPETSHGEEVETSRTFVIASIAKLARPSEPPRLDQRNKFFPARYTQQPTIANDPDLTPYVPGLTDSESIDDWSLPFETAGIRSEDNDYWDYFRTTPKAFVSPEAAKQMWASRFGQTTSIRIPTDGRTEAELEKQLLQKFNQREHLPGIRVVPIKANGLKASSGTTPFDALFLSLSMFVIGAALALVSLLFRLALIKRSGELGTLLAVGFRQKQAMRIWLAEMSGICLVGALVGVLLGVGYAALMLYGLKTWWVGAITTPFLTMHISWWTLPLGLLSGVLICVLTIYFSVRAARKNSVRALLAGQIEAGQIEDTSGHKSGWLQRLSKPLILGCTILAVLLTLFAAVALAGESQAGAFMTSGFLILVAALTWIHNRLIGKGQAEQGATGISGIAKTNAGRNPLRSTLTIGLVAVASFLILAISAFRLSPTKEGTAGFNYLATSSQPIFDNLNTTAGQKELLLGTRDTLEPESRVLSFRYKAGEDASCNNPYQSSQPQILGVTPATIDWFGNKENQPFSFAMTPGDNPWELLNQPIQDGAVPVIIDKNTAWYSLKVYMPGSEFTIDYDSGESIKFRLVGLLSNSVLQGALLVSESNFTTSFPDLGGYRKFLMQLQNDDELSRLTTSLSDQGFDAQDTTRLLTGYLAVQNTYLSTFQSLGLLGLLLGTFGLAAVQLRAIVERRKELGLMRAIGFTRRQLARMILLENAYLLFAGMVIGIFAALVTTLPHYFFGDATVPWKELFAMFAFIAVVGLMTSWLASRSIFRAPLLEALRAS